MKATYGFRATMKACPGEQAESQDEVPVGGKLHAGEMR